MKHLEEISRMRVDEAIQTGLRSQSVRRARNENKLPAPSASPKKIRQRDLGLPTQPNWITLLIYWLLGSGG